MRCCRPVHGVEKRRSLCWKKRFSTSPKIPTSRWRESNLHQLLRIESELTGNSARGVSAQNRVKVPGQSRSREYWREAAHQPYQVVGRALKMANRMYKPGERVPASGIYRVEHGPHRLMHVATLMGNTRFPLCKHCARSVRFFLVRTVKNSQVLPFRSNTYLEDYTTSGPELLRVG